jgi:hypothetical protein
VLNERSIAAAQTKLWELGWMEKPGAKKSKPMSDANRAAAHADRPCIQVPAKEPNPGQSELPFESGPSTGIPVEEESDDEPAAGNPTVITKRFTALYREVLGDNPTTAHARCVKDAVRQFASSVLDVIKPRGDQ